MNVVREKLFTGNLDTDGVVLSSLMKGNDYRSVVSISETCQALNRVANACSNELFQMPLRDRLMENAIVVYTFNHYFYLLMTERNFGPIEINFSPMQRIECLWQDGNQKKSFYDVENCADLLEFANNMNKDGNTLKETLHMVESFLKETFNPQNQEEVDRLFTFFRRIYSPAICSMPMLKVLLEMLKVNSHNRSFCSKLADAVECSYLDLEYCKQGSKNYTKFPEHRQMLASIVGFHPNHVPLRIDQRQANKQKVLAMILLSFFVLLVASWVF